MKEGREEIWKKKYRSEGCNIKKAHGRKTEKKKKKGGVKSKGRGKRKGIGED